MTCAGVRAASCLLYTQPNRASLMKATIRLAAGAYVLEGFYGQSLRIIAGGPIDLRHHIQFQQLVSPLPLARPEAVSGPRRPKNEGMDRGFRMDSDCGYSATRWSSIAPASPR